MPEPANKPSNALDECRQKVADTERLLEITAPRKLTVQVLETYENAILLTIDMLKDAKTEEGVKSRDAVRSYMIQARNQLSLAIVELEDKGVTPEYVNYVTLCQDNLEKALKYW